MCVCVGISYATSQSGVGGVAVRHESVVVKPRQSRDGRNLLVLENNSPCGPSHWWHYPLCVGVVDTTERKVDRYLCFFPSLTDLVLDKWLGRGGLSPG